MRSFYSMRTGWALAIYTLLDILCVGMGMGVPIMCILFGFPVGFYIVKRITAVPASTRDMLRRILSYAALTSAITFVLMLLVWGSSLLMFFDSGADLVNYGMPMILFEPLPSFIGWLVLMIVISPFLQFLMTLFGAHLTWLWEQSRG
jgi:hypothetical protein